MLCTDLMPSTDNAALEKREARFNAIRVDIAYCIDAILVLDRLVLAEDISIMQCLWVALKFIGHNHINIVRDIFFDVLRQRTGLNIFGMKEPQCAATLPDADNNFFLALWMTNFMLVTALLPADERFVNLYRAVKFGTIYRRSHSSADAMTEIPCGFIALFAEHSVNLTGRNALLGFGQQVCDEEPLSQWQMGVMKHGSHGRRELVVA